MGSLDQIPNAIEKFQKSQKKYTEIMIILAIVTAAAAISTVVLSYLTGEAITEIREINEKQFYAENFYPNLVAEPSDINLRNENNNTNWGYTDIITVYAVSNNFLQFTVKDVITVDRGGKCFFESGPNVELKFSSPVVFNPNDKSVEIKQSVFINYIPTAEFNIDTKNIEYNQGLVSLIYDIEVENMQTGDIYPLKSKNSFLWVHIPTEKDHLLDECYLE